MKMTRASAAFIAPDTLILLLITLYKNIKMKLYSNGRREKKKSTRLSTFTDLYNNINGRVAALHTRKRPDNFLQSFSCLILVYRRYVFAYKMYITNICHI